ncbi:MAG: glycolate oxidase subunit GlcE [Betaproteobacteria bacterium]
MSEAILGSLQARIRAAAAAKTPLVIRGAGTRDFYGQAIDGDVLDMAPYAGIVDYDPTELVVTARAGTRVAEIDAALQASGQMLGCEPPRFGAQATLGGLVATGLSGPRRPYAGAVRDIVLGVRLLDGKGDDLAFGGRVMKNVAGFDIARLMTGALGTLGVLTEVSLKCLPLPKAETTRVLECPVDVAIRMMNEWGGKSLPISATCHYAGHLAVRLSGSPPAVVAAATRIGGSAMAEGPQFWERIRDQSHPHFRAAIETGAPIWRLSVKATAPHRDLGGEKLIEWGGALRWLVAGPRTDSTEVRGWAKGNGGHATLFHAADKSAGAFHPLPEAVHQLHRRLKSTFDPAGILNRGRFYPDF